MISPLRALLLVLVAMASLLALPARAQRTAGFGDWQLHLPTTASRTIADAGDRLYVAADNSFYVFDKDLKTVQLLSRRDGLSDVGVSTVAYDSVSKLVVVGYRTGTVDILRPDGRLVTSISDIQRKPIQGGKEISEVNFSGRLAYLVTPFGLVALDMQRLEIRDTYINIGPGGTIPRVFATAVVGDTLFAATSVGVLGGRLNTNLLDFKQWRRTTPTQLRWLVTHAGRVYGTVNGEVYQRSTTGRWTRMSYSTDDIRRLRSSAAGLLLTEPAKLTVLDGNTGAVRYQVQGPAVTNAFDAVRARSGPAYVANLGSGLVQVDLNGQNAATYAANAPASTSAFGISTDGGLVDIFTGGYKLSLEQLDSYAGFYEFDADGRWTTYDPARLPPAQFPRVQDLLHGTRTPDGTLYVASYGNGLLEWKGPGEFRQFTQGTPGVPLLSTIPSNPNYTRVTDVASDADGNVWVLNRHQLAGSVSGLFRFTPSTNTWRTVPYFSGSQSLGRIAVDDYGQAWVASDRRADVPRVTVVNLDGNARSFGTTEGLPNTTFYDIAKDRRGYIWVATEAGVAYYNEDPSDVFNSTSGFTTPTVLRGEGSGFQLLYSDVVNAIAVDGGNRKWFGTNNGLWLFNENGDEGLLHFTTANSPLPSNKVLDVAVNDRTGEVWVATDGGVVVYRGSATVTEGKVSCAKVFPNPVRQDFAGQVGITGIANNAEVKITDVSGTLVYQTRATGGTVTWNLADYNGRKVQSGVYLVMTSDAEGENGCIAKVAVVNGR
ncbi:T9SS type A sorting domain-containing protein [Hymenobacter busanensis]|uniref:T9SS type A sorting domain-containing protein n=1 Tax=Hymenobacter busanensis TaxID=2607656 RepID=A0A7L4ZXQ9_9BACT|nr:two-component regulator propeller domain-containing protein [Hymenobacter busanensis]KAA9325304.1 T9SS type A sorting domain-containing protein [Hymenobacter busanensis]QHJ07703.1 T9SS type A sorting domain-containing protein [Hymenobacter busanensis]